MPLFVPHVRGPRIGQRGQDPGTLPLRKGRPCTTHLTILNKDSDLSAHHGSTLNVRFRAHLGNTRYFVGGLAPHSTVDSMRAFFSKYGKVVDATVMVDRETGRSKVFGFVTFEDNSNNGQLVGKLGLMLDDKQVSFVLFLLGLVRTYYPCSD